jgi:hypothetical protein
MVEFLLARGALPNLPDDEPWAIPLAWAISGAATPQSRRCCAPLAP